MENSNQFLANALSFTFSISFFIISAAAVVRCLHIFFISLLFHIFYLEPFCVFPIVTHFFTTFNFSLCFYKIFFYTEINKFSCFRTGFCWNIIECLFFIYFTVLLCHLQQFQFPFVFIPFSIFYDKKLLNLLIVMRLCICLLYNLVRFMTKTIDYYFFVCFLSVPSFYQMVSTTNMNAIVGFNYFSVLFSVTSIEKKKKFPNEILQLCSMWSISMHPTERISYFLYFCVHIARVFLFLSNLLFICHSFSIRLTWNFYRCNTSHYTKSLFSVRWFLFRFHSFERAFCWFSSAHSFWCFCFFLCLAFLLKVIIIFQHLQQYLSVYCIIHTVAWNGYRIGLIRFECVLYVF